MYFVDRKLLEKRLTYFEHTVSQFCEAGSPDSQQAEKATERMCQMMIEVIMDAGNQMIDGFIMRDPGSYEDIIDILADEKVISKEDGIALKSLIRWRKELTQNYIELDAKELYNAFKKQSSSLLNFPGKMRIYLDNELGPVSAFLPQKE